MRISLKNGTFIMRSFSFEMRAPCAMMWLDGCQLRRQPEFDRFLAAIQDRNFDRTKAGQGVDDALDQDLRRRGSGSEAHAARVLHPFRLQFAAVGNQIAWDAGLQSDLAQAVGV